jgi:hypothetical protein
MGDEVRVTVIATGFGEDNQTTIVSDQIMRLQALAEAQVNQVNAMGQRLMDQMETRTMAQVSVSAEVELRSQAATAWHQSQHAPPALPEERIEKLTPLSEEEGVDQTQIAEGQTDTSGDLADTERPRLPRDILLAKAKAYRESQAKNPSHQPEQLSMDVEDDGDALAAARRLAREMARSPFDSETLEVPSYLRKKQQADEQNSDGI